MARVKHTLQNGVVHLRQQNSGKLAAIDVSLYEYINEEDKPADEYEFKNGGQSSFSFTAKGGTETSSIISRYGHDGSWEDVNFSCTNHPEWATVTTTANSVSIKASANEKTSLKSGSIELTQDTSNKKITIAVTLAGVEGGGGSGPEPDEEPETTTYYLNITPSSHTFDYNGGDLNLQIESYSEKGGVQTPERWKLKSDDGTDWITGQDTACEGNKTQEITLHCASYDDTTQRRSCNITFEQETIQPTEKTAMVTLTQTAKPEETTYTLTIEPSSQQFSLSAQQSSTDITITSKSHTGEQEADIPWEYVSGAGDWVTGYPQSGEHTQTFKVTVTANNTPTKRECTLQFRQKSPGNATATLRVTQGGTSAGVEHTYVFEAQPTSIQFDYHGGNKTVTVTSKEDSKPKNWKITTPDGVDWVDVTQEESGLKIVAKANGDDADKTEERSVQVTITQDDSGKTQNISITQLGYTPPVEEKYTYTFEVTPNNHIIFESSDTTGQEVTVNSYKKSEHSDNIDVPFTHNADDSEGSWIVVERGSDSNHFTIKPSSNNDTGADRTGTVTFTQSENADNESAKSVVITVTQKGANGIGG